MQDAGLLQIHRPGRRGLHAHLWRFPQTDAVATVGARTVQNATLSVRRGARRLEHYLPESHRQLYLMTRAACAKQPSTHPAVVSTLKEPPERSLCIYAPQKRV